MVNLTESEERMVSHLHRKQHNWHRHRWYCLAGAFAVVAIGSWLLVQTAGRIWGSERPDGEAVWVCPLAWYIVLQGVLMAVHTLTKWPGSHIEILLLKVLEKPTE